MEKIKCAAIKFYFKTDREPLIAEGHSHAYCLGVPSFMDIPAKDIDKEKSEQGFITNSDRFVSREEAYQIARQANQLLCERENQILFSEYVQYDS